MFFKQLSCNLERKRHDDKSLPLLALGKMLEKGVPNKFSLLRAKGGKGMKDILQFWFSTRP